MEGLDPSTDALDAMRPPSATARESHDPSPEMRATSTAPLERVWKVDEAFEPDEVNVASISSNVQSADVIAS